MIKDNNSNMRRKDGRKMGKKTQEKAEEGKKTTPVAEMTPEERAAQKRSSWSGCAA